MLPVVSCCSTLRKDVTGNNDAESRSVINVRATLREERIAGMSFDARHMSRQPGEVRAAGITPSVDVNGSIDAGLSPVVTRYTFRHTQRFWGIIYPLRDINVAGGWGSQRAGDAARRKPGLPDTSPSIAVAGHLDAGLPSVVVRDAP
jgi:hypothetical protein